MSGNNPSLSILIERIRENDPTLNELDQRGDNPSFSLTSRGDDYLDMIQALRLNHTITKVNLMYRFLMNLTEEEQSEFLEAIGSLPNLQDLRFATSGISGRPLRILNAGLSKIPGRLKSLSIQSIHFRETVYFKTEATSNTNDTEFVEFLGLLVNVLSESIESFTILDAEDTFDLNALVHSLLALPKLRELIIQAHSPVHQRLTQESIIRLFASESIRSLALRRLGLAPILAEPLMTIENNNQTLESLSLEQNGLDFLCGMSIAYLLSVNRTLKQLNLAFNTIPDDCGAAIVAALADNDTLISLDLTANILEVYTSRRIAHLLARNESTLQVLTLNQNPLGDEGVAMIAAGLENNTSLTELSLAETKISEASCSVLVASLQSNATLERLNLANNKLGDRAGIALAMALQHNSTVTSLNLQGNELRDPCVSQLAQMLKVNNTIERLNLGNNPRLTTTGYEALERVLMDHNYSLHHLWLPTSIEIVSPNSTIPSFTCLNRLGRKRLLDELDNAQLWMDVIQQTTVVSNLDSLYYLMRTNPAVVSWMRQEASC